MGDSPKQEPITIPESIPESIEMETPDVKETEENLIYFEACKKFIENDSLFFLTNYLSKILLLLNNDNVPLIENDEPLEFQSGTDKENKENKEKFEKFAYKPFSYFMMNNLRNSDGGISKNRSEKKYPRYFYTKIEESLRNIDIYSHNLKKSIEHSINTISKDIIDKSNESEAQQKKNLRIVLGLKILIFIVRITSTVTEGAVDQLLKPTEYTEFYQVAKGLKSCFPIN